jgi:tRNA U34 5-carboxymethylaminomethyl modifying enzyme MnmG/GidA
LVHEVDALGGEIGRMADRLVLCKARQYSSLSSAVLLLSWNMNFPPFMLVAQQIYGVLSNIHFSQILLLLHTWLSPCVCSLYRCYLQKRVLNRSKGPAVWALRAQTDKREYAAEMKKIVERCIIS